MKRNVKKSLFVTIFVYFVFSLCVFASEAAGPKINSVSVAEFTSVSVTLSVKSDKADGYRVYNIADGKSIPLVDSKKSTVKITDLTPNTSYKFSVKAFTTDKTGKKTFGDKFELSAKTLLSKPQNVKMSSAKEGSVTISWDKVTGAKNYNVLVKAKGDEDFRVIQNTDKNSLTIKDLISGEKYLFKVTAKSDDNTSGRSKELITYTKPVSSGLKIAEKNVSLDLSWNKGTSYTSYTVYTSLDNKKWIKVKDTNAAEYSLKIKPTNKTVYVKVVPFINKDGVKVVGTAMLASGKNKLIEVKNIKVIKKTSSEIALKWDKTSGAEGYRIYSIGADGKSAILATTKETQITVNKLSSDKNYTIAIYPYVKDGDKFCFGKKSNEIQVKTQIKPVSDVKAETSSVSGFKLSWKKSDKADSYIVELKKDGEKSYTKYAETKQTSITVKELSAGKKYYVRVAIVSKENSAEKSSSVTVYTKPAQVADMKVTKATSDSISLSWKKGTPITKYKIYISTDGEKWTKKGSTDKNTFVIKSLKDNTKYHIKVVPYIVNNKIDVNGSKTELTSTTKKVEFSISGSTKKHKGEYIDFVVKGTDVKPKDIKWSSSNSNVVSVKNGRLFAKGKGNCKVSAKYNGKTITKEINVTEPLVSYISATYDLTNGKYLYENRLNEKAYPGSTTKLITALVALKYCDKSMKMTVGSELSILEGGASKCGIYKGEKFTLEQLLYGMLLPSGCDAANTIAANVARKVSGNYNMSSSSALSYFAGLMNKYVKSLGGTGSHFINAHGYPYSNHYSTAHDMILVAKAVRANKTLAKITSTYSKKVTSLSGTTRNWKSTNTFINPNSKNYMPNCIGMKTGTTSNSYRSMIVVTQKNGHTIISCVFGAKTNPERFGSIKKQVKAYL